MPTTVDCPACQRTLRVPDRLLGKHVKCPECGDTFPVLPVLETATSSAQPETLVYSPDANPTPGTKPHELAALKSLVEQTAPDKPTASEPPPPIVEHHEEEHCPKCNALNPPDARSCGQCGAEFEVMHDEWEGRGTRRDSEPHRGQTVLTLGVISVVCGVVTFIACPFLCVFGLGLGIPAWVMGHRDLKKMRLNLMDPRGEPRTRSGWICGMVGTILGGMGLLISALLIVVYVILIVGIVSRAPGPGPRPGAQPPVVPAPVPDRP